jgi:hypothetical protein
VVRRARTCPLLQRNDPDAIRILDAVGHSPAYYEIARRSSSPSRGSRCSEGAPPSIGELASIAHFSRAAALADGRVPPVSPDPSGRTDGRCSPRWKFGRCSRAHQRRSLETTLLTTKT